MNHIQLMRFNFFSDGHLVDPRDNAIFYVGKAGSNLRPFQHSKFTGELLTPKENRIAEIRKATGHDPRVDVLRYGLTKESCFDVEAAIIDSIGLENLTNEVRGHGIDRGRQTAGELDRLLGAISVPIESISEPVMLFFINDTYSPTKQEIELYDATRQFWHQISAETRSLLADGKPKYRTAFAICDSIVVRVYSIEQWFKAGTTQSTRQLEKAGGNKWEFVGRSIDHVFLGKKLTENGETLTGSQKGFRYVRPSLTDHVS